MNLRSFFAFGKTPLTRQSCHVPGTVTAVKTCWWLKVNTKPVRSASLDGAVFPHILSFDYTVEGILYHGRCYVGVKAVCPAVGDRVEVCCEPGRPACRTVLA